jgi:hypothetical protein
MATQVAADNADFMKAEKLSKWTLGLLNREEMEAKRLITVLRKTTPGEFGVAYHLLWQRKDIHSDWELVPEYITASDGTPYKVVKDNDWTSADDDDLYAVHYPQYIETYNTEAEAAASPALAVTLEFVTSEAPYEKLTPDMFK